VTIKYPALLGLSICLMAGCRNPSFEEPRVSFDSYTVEDGFELQLVAAEPMIEAPVTLDFDDRGRIWVVEMRAYMPNLEGVGEDAPTGRITILEDLDKDGVADHSRVFIDSLVLPRAIAHVYGGLLYAEPPNLWFVEIDNDKPGKRTLVDSLYSDGGNVEMQPNGLVMNIDNWIYSAKSNYRYQRKNGQWIKEHTSVRGQWGISQDNFGRLYYNNNTVQLIGDYALPNMFLRNPYLTPKAAVDKVLTPDQRVYPLHPTSVNRGGEKGILSKDSILLEFTAACGPLVYRGDQFPADYLQNAFTCEPEGNLVKRNVLSFDGVEVSARQAWENKEFIASTDESFRPVNLSNGPDGALYVADMHRGIMQHKAYITPYYAHHTAAKKLDTILGMGRILRVKYKGKPLPDIPAFEKTSASELVALLEHQNGWIRDRAQQLLIFRGDRSVIPSLEKLALNKEDEIAALHALHTLNGLDALSFDLLKQSIASGGSGRIAHALVLLEGYNTGKYADGMAALSAGLMAKGDAFIDLYLALSLGPWASAAPDTFLPLLAKLSQTYSGDLIYQEAVVSSLGGAEEKFRDRFQLAANGGANDVLDKLLAQTIANKKEEKKNSIFAEVLPLDDTRTNGMILFRSTCATCHGVDGNGIENMAPPLKGSHYVSGSVDKLGMIILHGLQGPIHINGQLYDLKGSMPGFANNFTDEQITDIIRYLHNAFVTEPKRVTKKQIQQLRNKRTTPLTEKELMAMSENAE